MRSNEDHETNVTDVNGVGEDDEIAEGGDEDVSGGEMEPPHFQERLDPRNKPTQETRGT